MIHTVQVTLLNDNATAPTKAHTQDAGWDLYASEDAFVFGKKRNTIKTGIALEMPSYFAGLIWPRSGLSVKSGVDVLAGVVDSGYRGEIMVCLYNTSDEDIELKRGDRIAQIIFQEVPEVGITVSDSLGSSQRGSNGFGSTGK
jgi:dUTP pyrophosphatase